MEQKILQVAEKTKQQPSWVSRKATEEAIRRRPTLEPDQAEAVRHAALAPGQVKCVLGGAGTGKTFASDCAREAIEASGGRVIGTSLSNRATRELKNQGNIRECYNIRKLIYELDRGRLKLDSRTFLFMDEAATTGTRDFARIQLEIAKSGATLVCVGDYRQHQAIEAGGVFLGLSQRHAPAKLETILRQRDPEDKKMVEAFRDRNIAKALSSLVHRGRLYVGDDVPDAQDHAVKAWGEDLSSPADKLFIASTNKQVESLNERCQKLRAERGELSGAGIAIKDGNKAFVGDRVLLRQ